MPNILFREGMERPEATLEKSYAMIRGVTYRPAIGQVPSYLWFDLSTAEYGVSTFWEIRGEVPIKCFLDELHESEPKRIEGKVIEIYRDVPLRVVGIGVNPHLIL